ncbi:uncharacterized protein METZ01_LOCUS307073 [marine metagenome]|uniref:Uncharacterized protein n=1 Tax=marine metagenome TaxID=408172 RepID=A0A382MZ92_9ZZZZ
MKNEYHYLDQFIVPINFNFVFSIKVKQKNKK